MCRNKKTRIFDSIFIFLLVEVNRINMIVQEFVLIFLCKKINKKESGIKRSVSVTVFEILGMK